MKPFTLTFELKIVELNETMSTQHRVTDGEITGIKREIVEDPMNYNITVSEILAENIAEEVAGELHTQLWLTLERCLY